MQVFRRGGRFSRLSQYGPVDLPAEARDRLRALGLWQETGDVRLACRTFGLSRATLYRWRKRFDPRDLTSLKERSRRPHRVRKPQWPWELAQAIRRLRERSPRWGKDKLGVLLQRQGFGTSASTVGRILTQLKRRGQLLEPQRPAISARRRRVPRPYAARKPKDDVARQPGDLGALDTLEIRPLPGIPLKQFTARDVGSRWDVLEAHSRATAPLAAQFLDAVQARMPFPIRACQVDGGSECSAEFEAACQRRGIRLFVLPPKSPKLNGAVERALRTHTEECYEVTPCSWRVEELNQELVEWEKISNTIRPHQALGYLTPLQFLQHLGIIPSKNPSVSQM